MAVREQRSPRSALSAVTGVLALGAFSLKVLEGAGSTESRVKGQGDLAFLAARSTNEVAVVDATLTGDRPRIAAAAAGATAGQSSLASGCSMMAGVAAATLVAASAKAARSAVRRRAAAKLEAVVDESQPPPVWMTYWRKNQTAILPTASNLVMTAAEKDVYLAKKMEAIREILPQTHEDFDDQVDELTYEWERNQLAFKDPRRKHLAFHKRMTLLKQRTFFEQASLFKPLIMKYPTLSRRFTHGYARLENRDSMIRAEWFSNEERCAGFSYEDFVKEQSGKGIIPQWMMPMVGDTIKGVVMALSKDGAFIEVGGKTWAFAPLANVSLAPIASAEEALFVGQEVEARVVGLGASSKVLGDPAAQQIILSLTELERELAWDEIEKLQRGIGNPVIEVTVKTMRPWGAVVQTKEGLEGFIRNGKLAGKASDTSLVGMTIPVQLKTSKRDKPLVANPTRMDDYAIEFDYSVTSTMDIAKSLEKGQVLTVKVKQITPVSLEIDYNGTMVAIKKADILDKFTLESNLADYFQIGDVIKAFVISKLDSIGALRLSLIALQRKPGDLLEDREGMFAAAEETAKKYMEAEKLVISDKATDLVHALEGNDIDPMEDSTSGQVATTVMAKAKSAPKKRMDLGDESPLF